MATTPSTDVRKELARVVSGLPGGGEPRTGQVDMAEAVAQALDKGGVLLAQAGTGTGKSLAYLVPAVLSGKRVVVATATKALQDQLAEKDLPFLQEVMGRRFGFAVLKGRSNYICAQKVAEATIGGDQLTLEEASAAAAVTAVTPAQPGPADGGGRPAGLADELRRLIAFASQTEAGDRAALDFEPSPQAWSRVSVTSDQCPGVRKCESGGSCFAERARQAAAESDVIVVNMHLYGAHLASGGAVLPEHEAVVFDEAHELEDILAASLGWEVGPGRVRALAHLARSALATAPDAGQARSARARSAGGPSEEGSRAVDDVIGVAARLEDALRPRMGERLPAGIGGELEDVLRLAAGRLRRLASLCKEDGADSGAGAGAGGGERQGGAASRALLGLESCWSQIEATLDLGNDRVAWVEGGERAPLLRVAPIDVAPAVRDLVFDQMPAVMATATMPAGLALRLGAEPDEVKAIDVGSPFPYERHAVLYCATHLPDRRHATAEAFESAQGDELASLIEAAGGRTMALFTSWSAMQRAAASMRKRLDYEILAQGELPKPALVAAFTREPSACLFATMGFWQGVDVPGPTLSLVIVDRIPFPRPDDPLLSARRERVGAEAFRLIDLPRAATLLAQGAGRLIRSATDRGVVAVLDPRLATASYRWVLIRAMPPMHRTRDRAEVEAFLRSLRDGG